MHYPVTDPNYANHPHFHHCIKELNNSFVVQRLPSAYPQCVGTEFGYLQKYGYFPVPSGTFTHLST